MQSIPVKKYVLGVYAVGNVVHAIYNKDLRNEQCSSVKSVIESLIRLATVSSLL